MCLHVSSLLDANDMSTLIALSPPYDFPPTPLVRVTLALWIMPSLLIVAAIHALTTFVVGTSSTSIGIRDVACAPDGAIFAASLSAVTLAVDISPVGVALIVDI